MKRHNVTYSEKTGECNIGYAKTADGAAFWNRGGHNEYARVHMRMLANTVEQSCVAVTVATRPVSKLI